MEKSMENPKNNPKLPTGSGEKAEPKVMQRWSAARKREIVLRLLRGESLDMISREIGLEPYRLERWRDKALASMDAGLKERADDDPLQAGLDAAHKRVGELSMEVELLRAKIGRLEAGTPFHRARSRR
jgi:transposase-like protein